MGLAVSRTKDDAMDADVREHVVGPDLVDLNREDTDGEDKFDEDEYHTSDDEAYKSLLESPKDIMKSGVRETRNEDYQAALDMEFVEAGLDQIEHRKINKSSSTSRVTYYNP